MTFQSIPVNPELIYTIDAVDASTTQALVNELKAAHNKLVEININLIAELNRTSRNVVYNNNGGAI